MSDTSNDEAPLTLKTHDTLDDRDRLSRDLEPIDVERDGEQRGSLRVDEMSAPKIAGVVRAAEHDFRRTGGKALGNDVGSVDAALGFKSGEKNGVCAREHLWPSMRDLTLAQCRNGFRPATGRWHAQQCASMPPRTG